MVKVFVNLKFLNQKNTQVQDSLMTVLNFFFDELLVNKVSGLFEQQFKKLVKKKSKYLDKLLFLKLIFNQFLLIQGYLKKLKKSPY